MLQRPQSQLQRNALRCSSEKSVNKIAQITTKELKTSNKGGQTKT